MEIRYKNYQFEPGSEILKHESRCCVCALRYYATEMMSDYDVLRKALEHGYVPGYGMHLDDVLYSIAEEFGFEVGFDKRPFQRIEHFIADHPKGQWIVMSYNHTFCIDNGTIVDEDALLTFGLNPIIETAYEVNYDNMM